MHRRQVAPLLRRSAATDRLYRRPGITHTMRTTTLLLLLSASIDGAIGPAAAAAAEHPATPAARDAAAVPCVRLRDDAVLCGSEVFQRVARSPGRSLQANETAPGWEGAAEELFDMDEDAELSLTAFWLDVALVAVLVLSAGLFSGLNIGLMALDVAELEQIVSAKSSSVDAVDLDHARQVLPVVRDTHLTLVTLLLCNCAAMEALPIFLDEISPSEGMSIVRTDLFLSLSSPLFSFFSVSTRYVCSTLAFKFLYVSVCWLLTPRAARFRSCSVWRLSCYLVKLSRKPSAKRTAWQSEHTQPLSVSSRTLLYLSPTTK